MFPYNGGSGSGVGGVGGGEEEGEEEGRERGLGGGIRLMSEDVKFTLPQKGNRKEKFPFSFQL